MVRVKAKVSSLYNRACGGTWWKYGPLLCVLIFGWGAEAAQAIDRQCQRYYRQKSYVEAGRCFESLLAKIDANPKLKGFARLIKDRYLRHAAISYNKAAGASTDMAKRSFYLEAAMNALLRSVKAGYCEASNRCSTNTRFALQLKEEIGFGSLAVITGSPKASIQVKGFRYKKKSLQKFNQRLRPGRYTMTISRPGQAAKKKTIEIQRNQALALNATEVQIKIVEKKILVAQKVPALVITGYTGGGVLMAAGGGMLVYSLFRQNSLNGIRSDPVTARTQTDESYNSDFDTAQTVKLVGGVVVGVGVLVLGGALIAHTFTNRANREKKETPKEFKTITKTAALYRSTSSREKRVVGRAKTLSAFQSRTLARTQF